METKLSFTITSAIALLLSACGVAVVPGSGEIVFQERAVSGFSQVVFSAPGELTLKQNGDEGLVIEADDNLLQYIKTDVQGDVLYIGLEPGIINLYPSKSIQYTLNVDALTRVTLNGSGAIRAGGLIASSLDFDLNGSGDILVGAVTSENTSINLDGSGQFRLNNLITDQFRTTLDGSGDILIKEAIAKTAWLDIDGSGTLSLTDIIADTFETKIDGSGNSTLGGEVKSQKITITGSGNYNAQNLQSLEANVRITGSGDANILVTEELTVTITGSGDITYRGEPTLTETVTGSGDISQTARQ